MFELVRELSGNFMPHGGCFLWQPEILWTHVLSDGVIALSYFSIPLVLALLVRRRDDLVFSWIFVMFASFILFCGMTHLIEIWTTWKPFYWTEGVVKGATALVSAITAVSLWPLLPKAVDLPSPSQLRAEVQQRKKAEQELRATNRNLERKVRERTKDLEQFVYAASHDLREPLRVIQNYSEYLEEDLENDRTDRIKKDLEYLMESSRQMREQIDSLLKLSRLNQQELDVESIDFDDVVDQVEINLEEQIQKAGAEIERDELPQRKADYSLMIDLLQNLVSNALKYAGEDPPSLRVTATREDGEWVVGVRDNGIGIPEQEQEEIFKPFVHLQSWDDHGGSGIGLSICRRIVERHNGEIWVESEEGQGAHFRFTLDTEGNATSS